VPEFITYIYIFSNCIVTQPVYIKHLHQGGPCRKKMQVKFMYLSTSSQKTNFHRRWFGWHFMKTNTVQKSSTWPINKNSLESLNRVVTLCNSKIHIYIANVHSIMTINSSYPSSNDLHSAEDSKRLKNFSLSPLNVDRKIQVQGHLKTTFKVIHCFTMHFSIQ